MTKREFLDIVFALAPNEANAIMDAFDEYYDGFPAQVTIKNCRDCTFNIYPSQIRTVEAEGET